MTHYQYPHSSNILLINFFNRLLLQLHVQSFHYRKKELQNRQRKKGIRMEIDLDLDIGQRRNKDISSVKSKIQRQVFAGRPY